MFTADDTFKKLADPTYYLQVVYSDLDQELFDKILYDDDVIRIFVDPDFIDDDGIMHYYMIKLDELISEIYQIAQSNIRIKNKYDIDNHIEFCYEKN